MASSHIVGNDPAHLVESRKGYDPRVVFFYFVLALLFALLAGGLGYQQLTRVDEHREDERYQSQRRVVTPGPRGNIYDRNGRLLVGNRARFSVRLDLDELGREIVREHKQIRQNWRGEEEDPPPLADTLKLARASVVQRYLDRINVIIGRRETVDVKKLARHFESELLLAYPLIEDLTPEEYARLLERLPVNSPAQVYTLSTRYYPFGALAAHTLGYLGVTEEPKTEAEKREKLRTFRMPSSSGRTGIEKEFDATLRGEAGTAVYRVDPSGNRLYPPLQSEPPKQGNNLQLSLDVDLQQAAEEAIGDRVGAAVALDVRTGEVLVLTSKPDYDLNLFSPRISTENYHAIQEKGAEFNNAIQAAWPPGSTFKILTSIAGLRRGVLPVDQPIVDCEGYLKVGNRMFPCEVPPVHHGPLLLPDAIAKSCEIFFYKAGELVTVEGMAAEARRFHLDQRTGIELPFETDRMLIPDPDWKQRVIKERWFPGDTALTATGQGFVLVSPVTMASFIASVARGETVTHPTLLHLDDRPVQRTEPIGLTPPQRAALLAGMEGCTVYGTAKDITRLPAYRVDGLRIAGKTGTAQLRKEIDGKVGTINVAWFVCFAPIENPEIALAVVIEGDTLGEEYGGGRNAAPVASLVMKKYFEKKKAAAAAQPFRLKTE